MFKELGINENKKTEAQENNNSPQKGAESKWKMADAEKMSVDTKAFLERAQDLETFLNKLQQGLGAEFIKNLIEREIYYDEYSKLKKDEGLSINEETPETLKLENKYDNIIRRALLIFCGDIGKDENFKKMLDDFFEKKYNLKESNKKELENIHQLILNGLPAENIILNDPIPPGTIFNSALELDKIKKLPKEEKEAALDEYKRKLAYQRIGLVQTQEMLSTIIENNPDITKDKLMREFEEFQHQYGFDDNQKKKAENIIDKYLTRHKAIEEIAAKHPDGKSLFKFICGVSPSGEVEIIKTPMTLMLRCHNTQDYNTIFQAGRPQEKKIYSELPLSKGVNKKYAGGISELEGAISAESTTIKAFLDQSVLKHEEQHAIYRFFNMSAVTDKKIIAKDFLSAPDENKKLILKKYLRDIRKEFENDLKDEILAFIKGQRGDDFLGYFKKDKKLLAKFQEKGGCYDYMRDIKENWANTFAEEMHMAGGSDKAKYLEMAREASKQILEDEYNNLIEESLGLVLKREELSSREALVALLSQEPLGNWKKLIERLKSAKQISHFE
jgi:hypothetical protein